MTQPLPDLQKRAVDLLPQLVTLIQQSPAAPDDPDSHPVAQRIWQEFSLPDDRIMGAILRAYLEPFIRGESTLDSAQIQGLQDVVTGNVQVWPQQIPAKVDRAMKHAPLGREGFYGMHKVTEDMLMQHYGKEAGTRLAATLALLSDPIMLPLGVITGLPSYSPHAGETVVEELIRQIGKMKGNNTLFPRKSVLEIGGSPKIQRMPQTQLFDYKNLDVGGRHASPTSSQYISLDNQPVGEFDYVMTNNVISPQVPVKTRTPVLENGNLFCTCANLTKQGGKIVHTNPYDTINSPPLYDADLHALAGVTIELPTGGTGVTSPGKCWIYAKSEDRQVTADAYKQWAVAQNKLAAWEAELQKGKNQARRSGHHRG